MKNEILRYDLGPEPGGSLRSTSMNPEPDGRWVLYRDHLQSLLDHNELPKPGHEEMRFEAAKAVLQGIFAGAGAQDIDDNRAVGRAISIANLLLQELNKSEGA